MILTSNWRILIFWARVVSASIALLAVVIAIILTPGFPNILLSLVAASMWSLISSFFIYIVTNNRASLEHWILQLSFEVSNIFANFTAFVAVLLLVYLPSLGGTKVSTSSGNTLTLMSSGFTLLSGLLWTTSSIYLVVHVRRESAIIADRERRLAPETQKTQKWIPPPKSGNTDTDTSSKGSRSAESRKPVSERRTSRLGSRLHRSMFIEDFEGSNRS